MAGQNNQNNTSSNTNNGTSGSSGSSGSNSGTPSRGKVSGGVDRDGNLTGTYKKEPFEVTFN